MVPVLDRYLGLRLMAQPQHEARFNCHDTYRIGLAARHKDERNNLGHLGESVLA